VQQKVELCSVAHDIARKRKKLLPAAASQEAATELGLAEDDEDIAFAEAQLLGLAEVFLTVVSLRLLQVNAHAKGRAYVIIPSWIQYNGAALGSSADLLGQAP